MHLVVVDDEEAVRDSLSRTLRFEGYTAGSSSAGSRPARRKYSSSRW
jgi:two-component system response regulator MprA